MSRRRRYKKKKNWFLRIFLSIILLGIIVVGGMFAYAYYNVNRSFEKAYNPEVAKEIEPKREESVAVGQDPISILILGKDTGEMGRTDVGRSDVIVVVTVNPNTNKATMTSIPRDTYTEIVGKGINDKINHAVAFGGVSMAVNTVQKLLDIPIDYFVSVDMGGFVHVIDALGGLEITPTQTFEQDGFYYQEGITQNMNGLMVLNYVRNRYDTGGDYSRQDRSREVIEALGKKVMNLGALSSLPSFIKVIEDYLETNLRFDDIQSLGGDALAISKNIEMLRLSGTGQMIDGVYYEILDETVLNQAILAMKQNLELQ